MKAFTLLGLVFLVAMFCTGASSCEEKAMEQYGIKIAPDPKNPGKYIVVDDPNKGNVGTVLSTAESATSGIPIAGQIVGGASILSNLLYEFLRRRAKAKVAELNAEYDNTHNATNAGLQSFIDSQPAHVGAALVAELDHAHDAADVHPEHQDAIQPIAKAA